MPRRDLLVIFKVSFFNWIHEPHSSWYFMHPAEKWHPPVRGRISCRVQITGFPSKANPAMEELDKIPDTQWR
jgi:hypothetical protein